MNILSNEQEPIGRKQHIYIQFQKIRPIRLGSYVSFPMHLKKHFKDAKEFKARIKFNINDINTIEKLAFVTRKWCGFGTFNILVFHRWNRNSQHKKRFKCKMDKCVFLLNGNCNNKRFLNTWKFRHGLFKGKKALGWNCRANPKFRPAMKLRARITIIPHYDWKSAKDYKYKYDKRVSKMHYFWFWRQ